MTIKKNLTCSYSNIVCSILLEMTERLRGAVFVNAERVDEVVGETRILIVRALIDDGTAYFGNVAWDLPCAYLSRIVEQCNVK